MRKTQVGVAAAAAAVAMMTVAAAPAQASKVGEPAPVFTARDSKGAVHDLAKYKGKWVVLEWHNQGCPYVKKHYEGGNMQRLQEEWTGKGVVWLTVISSAPGQQGHLSGADSDAYVARMKAAPSAVLLDEDGSVGRAYEAKTTPQMVVIGPTGTVVYNGAIDDKPTSNLADLAGAHNLVAAALTEGMAGKAVSVPTSRPYGCGIKYAK